MTRLIKNVFKKGNHGVAKILCLTAAFVFSSILISELSLLESMDDYFPGSERTYVMYEHILKDGTSIKRSQTPGGYASLIAEKLPQAEEATIIGGLFYESILEFEGRHLRIKQIDVSDSCLFNIFPNKTIDGDLTESLNLPRSCVISWSMAEKLGGKENLVGKDFIFKSYNIPIKICGIFEDFPYNSSLHDTEIILSKCTVPSIEQWIGMDRFLTIVKMYDDAPVSDAEELVNSYLKEKINQETKQMKDFINDADFHFTFKPITEVYKSDEGYRFVKMVMLTLVLVLLLSAVLNYILLVIGNINKRFQEMAVRKCYGASAYDIRRIIIGETACIVVLSVIITGCVLFAFRNFVPYFTSAPVSDLIVNNRIWILVVICAVVFVTGGLVPANVYSNIPVTAAFNGLKSARRKWKSVILGVEFACVSLLVCFLFVVDNHYRNIINMDVGYSYENVVFLDSDKALKNFTVDEWLDIKKNLLRLPQVEDVACSTTIPADDQSGNVISNKELSSCTFHISDFYSMDPSIFNVFEIPVVEGRTFKENRTDEVREIMVNRSFAEKYADLTGKRDGIVGERVGCTEHGDNLTIVGVFENFKFGNKLMSDEDTAPSIVCSSNRNINNYMFVRLKRYDGAAMKAVNDFLGERFPDAGLELEPYAGVYRDMYKDMAEIRNIISFAGLATLIIALTGLVGFLIGEVGRSRKQIAVRKINGASSSNVVYMFMRKMCIIALPSVIVGAAGAWFAIDLFVVEFGFKLSQNIAYYLEATSVLMLIIVFVTVSNVWRAATDNPVDGINVEN